MIAASSAVLEKARKDCLNELLFKADLTFAHLHLLNKELIVSKSVEKDNAIVLLLRQQIYLCYRCLATELKANGMTLTQDNAKVMSDLLDNLFREKGVIENRIKAKTERRCFEDKAKVVLGTLHECQLLASQTEPQPLQVVKTIKILEEAKNELMASVPKELSDEMAEIMTELADVSLDMLYKGATAMELCQLAICITMDRIMEIPLYAYSN